MFDFSRLRVRLRPLLWLGLLSPASCFALVCSTQDGGQRTVHAELGNGVAIPASLPDGEVVWRSVTQSLAVECRREDLAADVQPVYLYLNPDSLDVGQGIRAGLTLEDVDYLQSAGRLPMPQSVPPCPAGTTDPAACPAVRFNLNVAVFIQKAGATPPSGVASQLFDYRLFQLDGDGGPDPLPGRSLSYTLTQLHGLRFIACDAELQVYPETLEFGQLGIADVAVGKVFERRPFSLSTSRTCDSPFSLDARFRAISGTLSNGVLLPVANPSLGIRIVRAADGAPVPYNEPFHLAELWGENRVASSDFNAELLWQTDRPKAGPFEAEVMIDLYYK